LKSGFLALLTAVLTASLPAAAQDKALIIREAVILMPSEKDESDFSVRPREKPWARGRLTIVNQGSEDDRLLEVETPAARSATIWGFVQERDVMELRPNKLLVVRAGHTVSIDETDNFLEFGGVTVPLVAERTVPATLVFEKAGRIDVTFRVSAR
jgi:copper(I)-binding protein